MIQDADRLAFALAEGPAAVLVSERLADRLWTRDLDGDDWPAPVHIWLTDGETLAGAPDGLTGFIVGRLERAIAGGRIYLAWLGMTGVRLIDRTQSLVELDLAVLPDEGWTPAGGLQPPGAALHAHRGALYGLERLFVFSAGAKPVGNDLPDLPHAELQRALEDWAAESERGLAIFDLRLNLLLIEPDRVVVRHRWTSPDTCTLAWDPVEHATGYRVEESPAPTFAEINLLAELTDQRQVQYRLSPPANGLTYYRVVPINRGVQGTPSDPLTVAPPALSAPVLEPVRWAADGGFRLRWSALAQASGYEVEAAPTAAFDPNESAIVYRGESPEVRLPPDTPPQTFFRVRAINVLYAPHAPSDWSRPQQAPARLETPVFSRVSAQKLAWTPVPGARQYAVHITPQGQDEGQGDDYFTLETACGVADQPAIYRVRALRDRDDLRTASEWSEPVTLSPLGRAGVPGQSRWLALVIAGAALVALVFGAALGAAALNAYQDYQATAPPTLIPQARLDETATAVVQNAENATAVVQLGAQNEALSGTLQAAIDAEQTRIHIPTPTPSITPDIAGTFAVAFEAGLTATAARGTDAPAPTAADTPGPTPDWMAVGVCIASARGDRIGIVRSAPGPGGVALVRLDGPLVALEQRAAGGETWLRVWLADQGRSGWVLARQASLAPQGCLQNLAGGD